MNKLSHLQVFSWTLNVNQERIVKMENPRKLGRKGNKERIVKKEKLRALDREDNILKKKHFFFKNFCNIDLINLEVLAVHA